MTAYFDDANSEQINKAMNKWDEAYHAAGEETNVNACYNDDPVTRRACMLGLLEPVQRSARSAAGEVKELKGPTRSSRCNTRLTELSAEFNRLAREISELSTGLFSDDDAAQEKAADAYYDTVNQGLDSDFIFKLTQACYSPELLATLSPSAPPTG